MAGMVNQLLSFLRSTGGVDPMDCFVFGLGGCGDRSRVGFSLFFEGVYDRVRGSGLGVDSDVNGE